MTKSLQATFEKLHPRSGRFYDAETNRYFALSKQAGDTGKRVDSDSQQFWEFYQLAHKAIRDEARAKCAAICRGRKVENSMALESEKCALSIEDDERFK